MNKTYLSRSISRMMSADHPVGDPTGGVAYGEKNDPISAIVSIATMGGTYAAAGSFAAMTLMQGLTFAGAALSLAGNVTGNKTLSKIGMVAGLVGGIGSLAESFGVINKTSTLGETFGIGAAPPAATVTPPVTSQTPTANTPAAARDVGGYTPGYVNTPTAPTPEILNTAAGNTSTALQPPQINPSPAAGSAAGSAGTSTTAGGFMDYINKNPGMVMMGGQIASGLGDWLSGKTDAEIAALEAQSQANQANADLAGVKKEELEAALAREKLRRDQLNQGYASVNTDIKVNPYVAQAAQGESGLIAGAQQRPA